MNISSFSNELAPLTQMAIRERINPFSTQELILNILSNPSFSTLALCGILSATKSSISRRLPCILPGYFRQAFAQDLTKIKLDGIEESQETSFDTCTDVNHDQIKVDLGGPEKSQVKLFDISDIEKWTEPDDFEPDEIEGTLTHEGELFHIKQSALRTGIIGKSLIQIMNDITKSNQREPIFQELTYSEFKDRKTGKSFIGSNDCNYKPFSKLKSNEKSADINLHRLLANAFPGVHDGDMGINEKTQQSVLLDIEGTDFSLDGLAKFLRKCGPLKKPAESSDNQLFIDVASTFKKLKKHLKSNQDYIQHITQNLNEIDLTKLDRNKLIEALKKDSKEEGNFIDAETSVNLFFDLLESSESLSELFLNAQLNRIDTLIDMFTAISEETKFPSEWSPLQRGLSMIYPKLLEEQEQLLKQTNIEQGQHFENDSECWEAYLPNDLLEAKDSFTDAPIFTRTFRSVITRTLPNGCFSPLRVLMLVLKQADEAAQI